MVKKFGIILLVVFFLLFNLTGGSVMSEGNDDLRPTLDPTLGAATGLTPTSEPARPTLEAATGLTPTSEPTKFTVVQTTYLPLIQDNCLYYIVPFNCQPDATATPDSTATQTLTPTNTFVPTAISTPTPTNTNIPISTLPP